MKYERIFFIPGDESVYIDAYVADEVRTPLRDAMIIFPGGAYRAVCADREGEPIALAYLSRGVNSFVVKYSVGETIKFPRQLLDAARAFVYVKEHYEEFHINPDRMFVSGFSAGGHLAGSLAVMHAYAEELLGYDKDYCKCRGAVLAYPVVSGHQPTHVGSLEHLYAKPYEEITEEERTRVSLELNITEETPPMFIWHTALDQLVPPHGAINLARAYCDLGRSVCFHLYPYGKHGAALANDVTDIYPDQVCHTHPEAKNWLDDSREWMRTV